MRVALNIDLGELSDEPDELYALATVVNIACGGHAGDDESMARAVRLATSAGSAIAAHPSYPDRERFGRVSVSMSAQDLAAEIARQCSALAVIASRAGARVTFVKPHGALYHDARAPEIAHAIAEGVALSLGAVGIVGPPQGALRDEAIRRHWAYAREAFADRAYRDGALIPRTEKGALIADPAACAKQALLLAERGDVETICVHGDTPGAVAIASSVRSALAAHGLLADAA